MTNALRAVAERLSSAADSIDDLCDRGKIDTRAIEIKGHDWVSTALGHLVGLPPKLESQITDHETGIAEKRAKRVAVVNAWRDRKKRDAAKKKKSSGK